MKTSALLLIGFMVCAASAFSQTESEVRDRIVGTWKMVSAEDTMKDGTIRPYPAYGPHGKGFLMYQRDGYMCADLVNPDRPKWADPVHTTPEEKAAAASRLGMIRGSPGTTKRSSRRAALATGCYGTTLAVREFGGIER